MGEEMVAFYRIKKIKYNDRIYYYLYKEWYDPEAKKKRSKLIGRCDELEGVVKQFKTMENQWCGGWDLNPRRPTPSGPEPDPFDLARAPPLPSMFICFQI
jgi:hypothetical protein